MATKLVNKDYLSAKAISPTCHGNEILNKNEHSTFIVGAQFKKKKQTQLVC